MYVFVDAVVFVPPIPYSSPAHTHLGRTTLANRIAVIGNLPTLRPTLYNIQT